MEDLGNKIIQVIQGLGNNRAQVSDKQITDLDKLKEITVLGRETMHLDNKITQVSILDKTTTKPMVHSVFHNQTLQDLVIKLVTMPKTTVLFRKTHGLLPLLILDPIIKILHHLITITFQVKTKTILNHLPHSNRGTPKFKKA